MKQKPRVSKETRHGVIYNKSKYDLLANAESE